MSPTFDRRTLLVAAAAVPLAPSFSASRKLDAATIAAASRCGGGRGAHVYGRDLVFSSTQLAAGHRLKTNSVRGGYIEDSNTEDHVGTVRLEEFTLADQTAANTLEFIDDLVLVDLTIDGSPVTSG